MLIQIRNLLRINLRSQSKRSSLKKKATSPLQVFMIFHLQTTKTLVIRPVQNFGAREIWTIYAEAVLFAASRRQVGETWVGWMNGWMDGWMDGWIVGVTLLEMSWKMRGETNHFRCNDEVQPAVDNKNTLFGYFFLDMKRFNKIFFDNTFWMTSFF